MVWFTTAEAAEAIAKIKLDACDSDPKNQITAIRQATNILSVLEEYQKQPIYGIYRKNAVVATFVPVLKKFMDHEDADVVKIVLNAVRYFTDVGEEERQLLIDGDIIKRAISRLDHPEPEVKINALVVVHNFIRGPPACIKYVLDCGILSLIAKCLMHPHEDVHGLAIETLPFFLTGEDAEIQANLDENLVRSFVHLLDNEATKSKAMFFLIAVSTWGKPELILSMIDNTTSISSVCMFSDSNENYIVGPALTFLKRTMEKVATISEKFVKTLKTVEGLKKLKSIKIMSMKMLLMYQMIWSIIIFLHNSAKMDQSMVPSKYETSIYISDFSFCYYFLYTFDFFLLIH